MGITPAAMVGVNNLATKGFLSWASSTRPRTH
ncbi:hypothetical protein I2443_12210 [Corynebacterium phoceense]|nr:hypothetical protein [Corynebacterium phoceense]